MNIVEFAKQYKEMGYPHDHTLMSRVLHTDVSTSTLVYSQGEFLVELYLMHPNVSVVRHSHPFENVALFYSGELIGLRQGGVIPAKLTDVHHGFIGAPLEPNKWHEFKVGPNGCVFYNISRWDNVSEKDSAILKYIGEPLGPLHKKLLEV
jgi:hypothetical protein